MALTPEEKLIALIGEKEAQEFFILLDAAIEEGRVEGRAQARAEALEEAAQVVRKWADMTWPTTDEEEAEDIIAAIRSLQGNEG